MNIKLTGLAASLVAVMSIPAYAHTGFKGNLGTSTTATDIILFKCSTQVGIDRAQASVRDEVPVVATPPNIRVQIANANSTTNCNNASGWTPVQTTTGEGTWSPFTADITVNQTSPNNYYCIKVSKDTLTANSDDYQLNHHCGIPASGGNPAYFGHQASTFISYTQDQ